MKVACCGIAPTPTPAPAVDTAVVVVAGGDVDVESVTLRGILFCRSFCYRRRSIGVAFSCAVFDDVFLSS